MQTQTLPNPATVSSSVSARVIALTRARAHTQVWAWPKKAGRPAWGFTGKSDEWCRSKTIPPVLALQAHSAPLGITFYDWKASCGCKGGFPKSMDGASTCSLFFIFSPTCPLSFIFSSTCPLFFIFSPSRAIFFIFSRECPLFFIFSCKCPLFFIFYSTRTHIGKFWLHICVCFGCRMGFYRLPRLLEPRCTHGV